jgi:hypothetical protein
VWVGLSQCQSWFCQPGSVCRSMIVRTPFLIEVPEALLFDVEGALVVFEEAVIYRDADAVEAELADKGRVSFGEKMGAEALEEELGALRAEHSADGVVLALFIGRETGHPVFHVEPARHADPAQPNGFASLGDPVAVCFEDVRDRFSGRDLWFCHCQVLSGRGADAFRQQEAEDDRGEERARRSPLSAMHRSPWASPPGSWRERRRTDIPRPGESRQPFWPQAKPGAEGAGAWAAADETYIRSAASGAGPRVGAAASGPTGSCGRLTQVGQLSPSGQVTPERCEIR